MVRIPGVFVKFWIIGVARVSSKAFDAEPVSSSGSTAEDGDHTEVHFVDPVAQLAVADGDVSASLCEPRHVMLLDGSCELSWEYEDGDAHGGTAVKPPEHVRVLSRVDEEDLEHLRRLVSNLPSDAWTSEGSPLDYKQAVFHFPRDREAELSPYEIFAYAPEVHKWIEPMLLKIAQRYNYQREARPPVPGILFSSIPRLFLARLGPHQKQAPHTDHRGSSRRPHKIHVPVTESSGSTLAFPSERQTLKYKMPAGFAYEVNNLHQHYADNSGNESRINLLFEFYPLDVGSSQTADIAPDLYIQKQEKKKQEEQARKRRKRLAERKRRAEI